MFQTPSVSPRRKSEEERPFWISYADLMTAMMVLFLATMAVVIVSVSRKMVSDVQGGKERQRICEAIKQGVSGNPNINVACHDFRITFGDAGRFGFKDYHLLEGREGEANAALAQLVPVILRTARTERGRRYLKKVVVEGHASPVGSYLFNLHLSMQRSEWVMCLLTDPKKNSRLQLSAQDLALVQELFLAGGVSFNEAKAEVADEASQRVEMRLEFYGSSDDLPQPSRAPDDGYVEKCQLQ